MGTEIKIRKTDSELGHATATEDPIADLVFRLGERNQLRHSDLIQVAKLSKQLSERKETSELIAHLLKRELNLRHLGLYLKGGDIADHERPTGLPFKGPALGFLKEACNGNPHLRKDLHDILEETIGNLVREYLFVREESEIQRAKALLLRFGEILNDPERFTRLVKSYCESAETHNLESDRFRDILPEPSSDDSKEGDLITPPQTTKA
jgi:hypothetical protein